MKTMSAALYSYEERIFADSSSFLDNNAMPASFSSCRPTLFVRFMPDMTTLQFVRFLI